MPLHSTYWWRVKAGYIVVRRKSNSLTPVVGGLVGRSPVAVGVVGSPDLGVDRILPAGRSLAVGHNLVALDHIEAGRSPAVVDRTEVVVRSPVEAVGRILAEGNHLGRSPVAGCTGCIGPTLWLVEGVC